MRGLLPGICIILLLFLAPFQVCAEEFNPLVSGNPVKISETEDYYIIGTSSSLRVLWKNGSIAAFRFIPSLSDFALSGDRIYITLLAQDCPNVMVLSFPDLKKIWEFRPEMLVFDDRMVWQKKETKSWRVKLSGKNILVASGYTLYLLNPEGKPIKNLTIESDIWDFLEKNGKIYIASQNGYIYTADKNLSLQDKVKICNGYVLINPVTNETVMEITRSVWQVSQELYAACEDGSVYHIPTGKRIQIMEYSQSYLNTYYSGIRRETSLTDKLYKNIKLLNTPNGTLAYSSSVLSMLKEGESKWKISTRIEALDFYSGKIYIHHGIRYNREIISIVNLDGEEEKTLSTSTLSACTPSQYLLHVSDKGIVIVSNCEIKLVSDNGEIVWYIPTEGRLSYISSENITVAFPDTRYRYFENLIFYSIILPESGHVFILPKEMRENGYLQDVKILYGNVVLLYINSTTGEGEILIVDAKTGRLKKRLKASDKTYAGALDKYLLDPQTIRMLQDFDFSLLDEIPSEVLEGRIGEAIANHGLENVQRWLKVLENLPFPPEVMHSLKDVMDHVQDFRLNSRIRRIDICDINGDGIKDLLISSENLITARDGKTLKEIWLVDREKWRYELPVNEEYMKNSTQPWMNEDIILLCAGDVNIDGRDDVFAVSHRFIGFLESVGEGNYKFRWNRSLKDVGWEDAFTVPDVDGNHARELVIPIWRRDVRSVAEIIDSRTGRIIFTIPGDTFWIMPEAGDLNGDGTNESIILFEDYGAKLTVFSPGFEWKYEKITRFHDLWNKYGIHAPAVVMDVTDDGVKDLVFAVTEEDGGIKIVEFDVKDDIPVKTVTVEKSRWKKREEDWMYVNAMAQSENFVAFSAPVPEWRNDRRGTVYLWDIEREKPLMIIHLDAKSMILNDKNLMIFGMDGRIAKINLKGKEEKPYELSLKGGKIKIFSPEKYITVYINGKLSASGYEITNFMLSPGKKNLQIRVRDASGIEKIFFESVNLEGINIIPLLNTGFAVMFASALILRLIRWKRQ